MSNTNPLLDVTGLTKHFPVMGGFPFKRKIGAVQAVDGLDFQVAEGESLGLVVDLPQPDSPTRPRLSPSAMLKSSPSTAWTAPTVRRIGKPALIGKCLVSPVTSRRGAGAGSVPLMIVKSLLS